GAVWRGVGARQFVYVPGKRNDRVVLVAHADTFWEMLGIYQKEVSELLFEDGVVKNAWGGLGADDRAGCAILWLLKDLGHSILVTAGEENGGLGSEWLMNENPDIRYEINEKSCFAISLDRRNGRDFKCYSVGTDEFRKYIIASTGYSEPNRYSYTDIVTLCEKICGVNLSIGYYNEHNNDEFMVLDEWLHTLNICRIWLKNPIKSFRR
ncbi:MAG: hypothetical protein AB1403_12350, partial [Candidatus Riflebacteria bacterium]